MRNGIKKSKTQFKRNKKAVFDLIWKPSLFIWCGLFIFALKRLIWNHSAAQHRLFSKVCSGLWTIKLKQSGYFTVFFFCFSNKNSEKNYSNCNIFTIHSAQVD